MRKRILGVSVMTVALVAGLLAVPALAVKAPAPPRADAAAEQPEPPPPGGFCVDIDRDRKYLCVGRLRPARDEDCRVLVHLGTLVAYTQCGPRAERRVPGLSGPRSAPAVAGVSAQEKQAAAEGPLGNGFCVNPNRDDTWTCVLRNKPRAEPDCTTVIGIPGVLVHTDCSPNGPSKRSLR
jgi:hypothetical protein